MNHPPTRFCLSASLPANSLDDWPGASRVPFPLSVFLCGWRFFEFSSDAKRHRRAAEMPIEFSEGDLAPKEASRLR